MTQPTNRLTNGSGGPLPHRARARRGRHGHRLSRPRPQARPQGRAQGPAPRTRRRHRRRAHPRRDQHAYRAGRPAPTFAGRAAVLVDDGVATGATIRAAIAAARALGAARVVVAVPAASQEALALLQQEADEVICLQAPRYFYAVGAWYDDFPQVSDAEVRGLLQSVSGRASKKNA